MSSSESPKREREEAVVCLGEADLAVPPAKRPRKTPKDYGPRLPPPPPEPVAVKRSHGRPQADAPLVAFAAVKRRCKKRHPATRVSRPTAVRVQELVETYVNGLLDDAKVVSMRYSRRTIKPADLETALQLHAR